MAFGAGLTGPFDMTGLVHLMFLLDGGRDASMAMLLESLRREGVPGTNGRGLIGETTVQAMMRRFIKAGFIRKVPRKRLTGAKPGFGPQEYAFYREPAYNPDWSENDVDDQAQEPAAQASAQPQAGPVGPLGEQPPAEDPDAPAAEELAAAVDLLENLPDPWTVGQVKAQKLAPALARQVRRLELDYDQALVDQLTANPGGVRSYVNVLPARIKDLKRVRTRFTAARPQVPAGPRRPSEGPLSPCPKHPGVDATECEPCVAAAVAEREAELAAEQARREQRQRPAVESSPEPVRDPLAIIARAMAAAPKRGD
ncbi:hypothetical protein GXW82_44545 [Streptacidiphilus sp. 4-A2]|nr:hypothetical protein [Streptacidiphilus sp. 4-A2]